MATNSGGWLYEANGTPVDKATADNAQARVLEIKADASAAKSDAASALSTANSYAGQIAQANTTSGSALATAQGAEATADNAADRVDALEVMGGVQPGSVNDAEMKLHAEQDGGLFNTALNAQIDVRKHYADVRSHGAAGDGVADDTDAIQAALDTGLSVFVPAGVYNISRELDMSVEGQRLWGSGQTPSRIVQTNPAAHGITMNSNDAAIEYLFIEGQSPAASAWTAGINVIKGVRSKIHNNTVRRFVFGISSDNATQAWVLDIAYNNLEYAILAPIYLPHKAHATRIHSNEVRASKYGIILGRLNTDGTVDDTFNLVGAASTSIRDNTIEGNRDIDIMVGNGNFSTDIAANYFETAEGQPNKKSVIQVGTPGGGRAIGVKIDKNYFYTFPDYAADHPIIKLHRFMHLAVTNNDSLGSSQLFMDTGDLTASGSITFDNNYVNGGRYVSENAPSVAMTHNIYPASRNAGFQALYHAYDDTGTPRAAMALPNRMQDNAHHYTNTVFHQGMESNKTTPIAASAVTVSAGTVTVGQNASTVFELGAAMVLHLDMEVTLTDPSAVMLSLAPFTTSKGKKLMSTNPSATLGEFYIDNSATPNKIGFSTSDSTLRLYKGPGGLLDAGTFRIQANIVVPVGAQ